MKLTKESLAIVRTKVAHVEVSACPGSGKTTTAVHRVLHLRQQGVPAQRIGVVSFSNETKAVFAQALLAKGCAGVKMLTFHALGRSLVSAEAVARGHPIPDVEPGFSHSLLETAIEWMTERIKEDAVRVASPVKRSKTGAGETTKGRNRRYFSALARPERASVLRLLGWIVTEKGARQFGRLYGDHADTLIPIRTLLAGTGLEGLREFIDAVAAKAGRTPPRGDGSRLRALKPIAYALLAWIIRRYRKQLLGSDKIDFASMCLQATKILGRPGAASSVQFTHLIVDEYQDCSSAQLEMLKALAGVVPNVMVLGDRDQAIYGFAGGRYRTLVGLSPLFATARTFRLSLSHRLTAETAAFAQTLRINGRSASDTQADPQIRTRKTGPAPSLRACANETSQAHAVAARIRTLLAGGAQFSKIAVLARTNRELNSIQSLLTDGGIPVYRAGDDSSLSHHLDRVLGLVQIVEGSDSEVGKRKLRIGMKGVKAVLGPRPNVVDRIWKKLHESLRRAGVRGVDGRFVLCKKAYLSFHRQLIGKDDLRSIRNYLNAQQVVMRRFKRTSDAVDHYAKLRSDHQACGYITLSTAHRAKGKEWKHVMILGQTNGVWPSHHAQTMTTEAEERRLLYVAVTRASHSVELFCAPRESAQPRATFSKVSDFLRPAITQDLLEYRRRVL